MLSKLRDNTALAARALWWLAKSLVLPFKLHPQQKKLCDKVSVPKGRLLVHMAAWWAVFPASWGLFPSARDTVKEEGLDPVVVEELAPGANIRVQRDTALGKVSMMLAHPNPVRAAFNYHMIKDRNVMGVALAPGKFLSHGLAYNTCRIYLKEEATYSTIFRTLGGDVLISPSISKDEIRQIVLLHEIRHCSKENMAMPYSYMKETDAEVQAINALARHTKDPTLEKRFFHFVAGLLWIMPDYDSALKLDAQFRGVAPPKAEEMKQAQLEAFPVMKQLFQNQLNRLTGACDIKPGLCAPPDVSELSPLAQRRVELYKEGIRELLRGAVVIKRGLTP